MDYYFASTVLQLLTSINERLGVLMATKDDELAAIKAVGDKLDSFLAGPLPALLKEVQDLNAFVQSGGASGVVPQDVMDAIAGLSTKADAVQAALAAIPPEATPPAA